MTKKKVSKKVTRKTAVKAKTVKNVKRKVSKKRATKKVVRKGSAVVKKALAAGVDMMEDAGAPVSPEKLSEILDMASKAMTLIKRIDAGDKLLKDLKSQLHLIEFADLPALMESVQLKELSVQGGAKLEVVPVIRAALPAKGAIDKARGDEKKELQDRLKQGLSWLRKNKAGGMIDDAIKVKLGRGKAPAALQILKLARQLEVSAERTCTVNTQSLSAYVREQYTLENGKDVPVDIFAVFNGHRAKITQPKKSK